MCASANLSDDACDRAVLLTSELVTNALVHSDGDQRLTVTTRPGGVRVEVGDDSSDLPELKPCDDYATTGRGIQLLDLCATTWGVRRTQRGKCVWFDIVSLPEDRGPRIPPAARSNSDAIPRNSDRDPHDGHALGHVS
jgi:hypothetical protein